MLDQGDVEVLDTSFYPQLNIDAIVVLGAAIVVAIFFYLIPFLFYPFDLLFTMIHELGHVFATRFNDGKVLGFWVFSNASGVTRYEGGDPYLIIPAGYMGTALFTAGLILLTGLPYIAPYTLGVLGGLLILLVFLYGKQSAYKDDKGERDERTTVTAIVGLIFGVGSIGVAWIAHPVWSIFLLNLLAVEGIFTTLYRFKDLTQQVRKNSSNIDPSQMAKLIGCSPMFWTRVWSLLSILILGGAFWFTWLRDLSG